MNQFNKKMTDTYVSYNTTLKAAMIVNLVSISKHAGLSHFKSLDQKWKSNQNFSL